MTTKQLTSGTTEAPAASKRLAVVFGDVVDYSAVLARVGEVVVSVALQQFVERLEHRQQVHSGLLVKRYAGDSFMVVFEDPAKALIFAVELHQSLALEPILVADERLTLRMSVHSDILALRRTLYGEEATGTGVVVAAHLSGLAKPGQILVSTDACALLPAHLQAMLGPQQVATVKHGMSLEFRPLELAGRHEVP